MAIANTKTYLLFQPALLFSKKSAIAIKQLIKTPDGITTGEQPLTRAHIKALFKSFSDETIKALMAFNTVDLEKISVALYQQTSYIVDKEEQKAAVQAAYTRHIQSITGALRRQPVQDWYHPVISGDKRVQNIKCSFYSYPVEVSFYANKKIRITVLILLLRLGKKSFL
ncbi:hypothetical protein LWM68_29445 [Niabella sp. W65]|nr:hypothetical protein [Niabella sp. W65]MCH7366532.1 hypothetical protein [Niabella sp. W65]